MSHRLFRILVLGYGLASVASAVLLLSGGGLLIAALTLWLGGAVGCLVVAGLTDRRRAERSRGELEYGSAKEANEAEEDPYGESARVSERRSKMETLLGDVFESKVEMFPFILVRTAMPSSLRRHDRRHRRVGAPHASDAATPATAIRRNRSSP